MNEKKHNISRILFALAGVAACAAVVFVLTRPGPGGNGENPEAVAAGETEVSSGAGTPESAGSPEGKPAGQGIATPESENILVLDVAQTAAQLHGEDLHPSEDLLILQNLLDSYRKIHGANPEGGLNFEIVAGLAGSNERKLAVLPPDHPSLNQEGELLDRWGTPYWFHPVSKDVMEIVSAGPDKNLWTEDDVQID